MISVITMKEESKQQASRCETITKELKTKLTNQDKSLPETFDRTYNKKKEKINIKREYRRGSNRNKVINKNREYKNLVSKVPAIGLQLPPIKEHGRYLSKHEFKGAIKIRLGNDPPGMSQYCACGQNNSVIRAKNCHRGGYIKFRHDKIRDYIIP